MPDFKAFAEVVQAMKDLPLGRFIALLTPILLISASPFLASLALVIRALMGR